MFKRSSPVSETLFYRLQQALDQRFMNLDHNLHPAGMHIRQTVGISCLAVFQI